MWKLIALTLVGIFIYILLTCVSLLRKSIFSRQRISWSSFVFPCWRIISLLEKLSSKLWSTKISKLCPISRLSSYCSSLRSSACRKAVATAGNARRYSHRIYTGGSPVRLMTPKSLGSRGLSSQNLSIQYLWVGMYWCTLDDYCIYIGNCFCSVYCSFLKDPLCWTATWSLDLIFYRESCCLSSPIDSEIMTQLSTKSPILQRKVLINRLIWSFQQYLIKNALR